MSASLKAAARVGWVFDFDRRFGSQRILRNPRALYLFIYIYMHKWSFYRADLKKKIDKIKDRYFTSEDVAPCH